MRVVQDSLGDFSVNRVHTSTVAPSLTGGETYWFRWVLDTDNGASGTTAQFFYAADTGDSTVLPSSWTQVGADVVTAGTLGIYDPSLALVLPGIEQGFSALPTGTLHRAFFKNTIGGTVVFDADFAAETAGTLSFIEDSANAATVSLTTTYGQVSQWDDLSGSGNNVVQPTAANQPRSNRRTLNNLNVIDFDGSGELLAKTFASGLTQPNTLFVVGKLDATGSERAFFDGVAGGRHLLRGTALNFWLIYSGTFVQGSTTNTDEHIFRALYNSTSSTLHIDGTLTLTGNAGTEALNGAVIGAVYNSSSSLDGLIAEVIVIDGTLTADQITATEEYLGIKWGIYTAPDQITDLTAYPDNQSVDLTWTAPADNGLSISDYLVQYSTDGSNWTTVETASTSLTVSGLSNGVEYDFRVAAKNAAGVGVVSSVVSVSPFDVLSLSPALWLDASDTSTITESGGAVSQWDDLSGNGYDVVQATAAKQPRSGTRTINGLNVLDFDGADQLLVDSGVTLTQPNTLIAVMKFDTVGIFDYPLDGANGTDRHILGALSPATNWAMYTNTGLIGSVAISTTTQQLLVGVFNTTSSVLRVDGVQAASGNAGSTDYRPISVGSGASGSSAFDGIIAEIIVIDGLLTADQITATESYLAQKWGITL